MRARLLSRRGTGKPSPRSICRSSWDSRLTVSTARTPVGILPLWTQSDTVLRSRSNRRAMSLTVSTPTFMHQRSRFVNLSI